MSAGPVIIGVDPGLTGGVAVLDADRGQLLAAMTMPTVDVKKGKRELDVASLHLQLQHFPNIARAVVEKQAPMPINMQDGRRSSPQSTFSMGEQQGMLRCLFSVALSVQLLRPRPQDWKKALGLTADKAGSIAKAHELFPDARDLIGKNDGKAEAALLAWWGYRHHHE